MPFEAKPLFRPDVIRSRLSSFDLPSHVDALGEELAEWAERVQSPQGRRLKEREILDRFIQFFFIGLLGYTGAEHPQHTLSREKHVEVEGTFADAVLGHFGPDGHEFVIAFEGKSPRDPLERPFKGRRLSAVQQAYQYAINLPCDWLIVSSIQETRLYYKGSNQQTYERFTLQDLARDELILKKLVYLLGAGRCVLSGRCHLYDLLEESERADEALTKSYYQRYTEIRYDVFRQLCEANPDEDPKQILTATQKLLDRVLFCAFCEDRGLLPADILQKATQTTNPFAPTPLWENFRGLFRFIDQGNPVLSIPAYDGGLFAPDELLDRLQVPDEVCAYFGELGEYDYRPEINGDLMSESRQIDVEILGHIFEQSITDLERLSEAIGAQASPEPQRTRRRAEGAFYTPSFITRYIVQNTLDPVLEERFEKLRLSHQESATRTAVRVLEDPRVYDLDQLNKPQRTALRLFWEAWHQELGTIRILDPACGSGAFLIEAFDQLFAAYQNAGGHLEDLKGQLGLYDVDRRILQDNLYGVDINQEAVQICRLSLWIKTAKRDRILTSLDHTIRVGNSIVGDPRVDPRAFDWDAAFPEVGQAGGFDVVLGNPPYIRQELLGSLKGWLKENYSVHHGMADLYVYFFEAGFRRLRSGGRLSFVVTNKWLRANYAENLRRFLAEQADLQSVVDLGHAKQIFEDADVFPSIVVIRRPQDGECLQETVQTCSIPREQLRLDDLQSQVRESGVSLGHDHFGKRAWSLESADSHALLQKINQSGRPLADYCEAPIRRGILTGFNQAFLVDSETRQRLLDDHPECESLFKPYVRGQDIGRWRCTWGGLWMIALESSSDRRWPWSDSTEARQVFQKTFPSIAGYFSGFQERLRKRRDQGTHWWELRSCSYWQEFERPKILYQVIQYYARFAFDDRCLYSNDKTFFIPTDDLYLLGVLNSPLMWWRNWRTLQHLKDEALSPMSFMMEKLPVALPDVALRREVEERVRRLVDQTEEIRRMRRRILHWLTVEFSLQRPSRKLQAPEHLELDQFLDEVRRLRPSRRPLSAAGLEALRAEYFRTVEPVRLQRQERRRLESEISGFVNQAYGLTPEESELMWSSAPPRMPAEPSV